MFMVRPLRDFQNIPKDNFLEKKTFGKFVAAYYAKLHHNNNNREGWVEDILNWVFKQVRGKDPLTALLIVKGMHYLKGASNWKEFSKWHHHIVTSALSNSGWSEEEIKKLVRDIPLYMNVVEYVVEHLKWPPKEGGAVVALAYAVGPLKQKVTREVKEVKRRFIRKDKTITHHKGEIVFISKEKAIQQINANRTHIPMVEKIFARHPDEEED
tara:strand:+ start:1365 stop:2000 length:636 start_codon:yes stop_codon:yes gene_type:complete